MCGGGWSAGLSLRGLVVTSLCMYVRTLLCCVKGMHMQTGTMVTDTHTHTHTDKYCCNTETTTAHLPAQLLTGPSTVSVNSLLARQPVVLTWPATPIVEIVITGDTQTVRMLVRGFEP